MHSGTLWIVVLLVANVGGISRKFHPGEVYDRKQEHEPGGYEGRSQSNNNNKRIGLDSNGGGDSKRPFIPRKYVRNYKMNANTLGLVQKPTTEKQQIEIRGNTGDQNNGGQYERKQHRQRTGPDDLRGNNRRLDSHIPKVKVQANGNGNRNENIQRKWTRPHIPRPVYKNSRHNHHNRRFPPNLNNPHAYRPNPPQYNRPSYQPHYRPQTAPSQSHHQQIHSWRGTSRRPQQQKYQPRYQPQYRRQLQHQYQAKNGYQQQKSYEPKPGYQPQHSFQPKPGYQPQQGYQSQQRYQPHHGYQQQHSYQPQHSYQQQHSYQPQHRWQLASWNNQDLNDGYYRSWRRSRPTSPPEPIDD